MATFRLIENFFSEVNHTDFFDKIALVAHNCYQVKEKDHASNIGFIQRLVQSGHLAMMEHYRFAFVLNESQYHRFLELHNSFYELGEYMREKGSYHEMVYLLSCSIRPILENLDSADVLEKEMAILLANSLPEEVKSVLLPNLKGEEKVPLFDVEKNKDKIPSEIYDRFTYVTYHLITDRGVTHELVRHRICSFAQESTRYCNYTKDKFDACLTFMKPSKYEERKEIYDVFYQKCSDAYFELIQSGATPDEARAVLPNSLKASIMVTCNLKEWKKIFFLRTDPHAHFDIRRLMLLVQEDMIKKGYIHDEEGR